MQNSIQSDLQMVMPPLAESFEELRGKRIFITGGTGFFGKWLLETLAWAKNTLSIECETVVLSRRPQAFIEQAPHLCDSMNLRLIEGDVRDFEFPNGTFQYIIHAAASSSAEMIENAPLTMFDTIVDGTKRVLKFAHQAQCQKLLFVSSGAVYGQQPPTIQNTPEDFKGGPDILNSNNCYAEGKRAAELLCSIASQDLKAEIKIARCFAFVGPHLPLNAHFAAGNFIRDGLAGELIKVQGDGTPMRSYLYASDLMQWLWMILFHGKNMRAYNVGSDEEYSIAELANRVSKCFAPEIPIQIAKTPTPGQPSLRYVPSIDRARDELGLKVNVHIDDAIQRTISWHRNSEQ